MTTFVTHPSGKVTASKARKTYQIPPIEPYNLSDDQEFTLRLVTIHGLRAVLDIFSELATLDKPRENPNRQRVRGSKGMTSKGADIVRDAAFLLEKKYGRDRLTFFTGTLTPDSDLLNNWTRDRWAAAIDLFKRRIIYLLDRHSIEPHIVGVTELQQQRFNRTGELAYHIHWVWVGRHPKGPWIATVQELQRHWDECCNESMLNGSDNGNENANEIRKTNASTNVERVKKSVVGYLGKYLSKGRKFIREMQGKLGDHQLPSAWYICTAELRRMVERSIIRLYDEAADFAIGFLRDNADQFLSYDKTIYWTAPDGFQFAVGWYGYLKVPWEEIF